MTKRQQYTLLTDDVFVDAWTHAITPALEQRIEQYRTKLERASGEEVVRLQEAIQATRDLLTLPQRLTRGEGGSDE